jgi:hypothetical protein
LPARADTPPAPSSGRMTICVTRVRGVRLLARRQCARRQAPAASRPFGSWRD